MPKRFRGSDGLDRCRLCSCQSQPGGGSEWPAGDSAHCDRCGSRETRAARDASRSHDPDGQSLHYTWFHYAEAGGTDTKLAAVTISGADTPTAVVTATSACRPQWLSGIGPCSGTGTAHIILAVTDDGSPRLTSYRRVILNVRGGHQSEPRPWGSGCRTITHFQHF